MATPIYVDYDNGNDVNDGETTGNSIKTWLEASQTQVRAAGDVVYFRAGDKGGHWLQGTEAVDITFDEGGSKDAYVEYRGASIADDPWGDASNVKPIINFEDTEHNFFGSNDKRIKFTRLDIRQSADTNGAIYLSSGDDWYFQDCVFSDSGAIGSEFLLLNSCETVTVDGCTFTDGFGTSMHITLSKAVMKGCTFTAGGVRSTDIGLSIDNGSTVWMSDVTFSGTFDTRDMFVAQVSTVFAQNVDWATPAKSITEDSVLYLENDDATYGDHIIIFTHGTITRETTIVRGGGADSSIKMSPTATCGINRPLVAGHQLSGFRPLWVVKDVEIDVSVWANPKTAWGGALNEDQFYVEFSYLSNAASAARVVLTSTETIANADAWTEFTSGAFTPLQTGFIYMWAKLAHWEDAADFVYVDSLPVATAI